MQKNITVAIIDRHDRLLLLLRGDTAPWMPNRFCLPGGGVNENESLIDGAVREVYEETSIELDTNFMIPMVVKYGCDYSKIVYVYKSPSMLSVGLNWEHSDYHWATITEALEMKLVPGLRTTIKTLRDSGHLI